jgi:hypothetical protein
MVTTTEISPSPQLASFVRCYAYREFDTNGSDVTMPWRASHDTSIIFSLKTLLHREKFVILIGFSTKGI